MIQLYNYCKSSPTLDPKSDGHNCITMQLCCMVIHSLRQLHIVNKVDYIHSLRQTGRPLVRSDKVASNLGSREATSEGMIPGTKCRYRVLYTDT
jgi:hypothetical protein